MAKLNYIMLEELEKEQDKLTDDFNDMKKNIVKVETELMHMKNNLNALAGAIQLTNKLIKSAKTQEYDEEQEMNRLTDKFKETKE